MNKRKILYTAAAASILALVASLGIITYASASGDSGLLHGGFKRMHSMQSHDKKMEHVKSYCKEGGHKKLKYMTDYIEDRFEFSEDQSEQWSKVVDALYSEETTIQIICDKMLTKENHETTPARLELMETVTLTGLEAMQRIRPVISDFYFSLNDKQKRTLDDLLSHKKHHGHGHI